MLVEILIFREEYFFSRLWTVDHQTYRIGESYSHDVRHALLIFEEDILAEIHKEVIFSCRRILGNVYVATDEGQDAPVKDHTLTLVVPDLRVD